MADLLLYHAVPSRSAVTLWMLEEVGEPYDIHMLNLGKGEQLRSDYLEVNPLGKVPALKHRGVVITEVAAICTYLADEFPNAKLNVPVGDPRRGPYLKWLFFPPSIMEPAVNDKLFPRKQEPRPGMLGYRSLDTVLDVVLKALAPGLHLLGEQFTTADVLVGAFLRWGMLFEFIPRRPEFVEYVGRLSARPAAERADDKDKQLVKG